VANMEETDALVEAWSRTLNRSDIMEQARQHRLPVAAVRDLVEVTNDPHMHERGMLEWLDHPEYGRLVVPTSPLRFHGADKVETSPSPRVGQHTQDVLQDWLGMSESAISTLRDDGAI
ncbi:MAG: CoA transferase, partial [Pseudomonadota bacterium]